MLFDQFVLSGSCNISFVILSIYVGKFITQLLIFLLCDSLFFFVSMTHSYWLRLLELFQVWLPWSLYLDLVFLMPLFKKASILNQKVFLCCCRNFNKFLVFIPTAFSSLYHSDVFSKLLCGRWQNLIHVLALFKFYFFLNFYFTLIVCMVLSLTCT